jgi:alginate O-acetyltransferase complex protein AlgI
MVFSSNVFLLYFFPIFLALYFITPKKFRNYTLLLASFIFYAYGAPEFVIQLIVSNIANFYLVKYMHRSEKPLTKKILCGISITISI